MQELESPQLSITPISPKETTARLELAPRQKVIIARLTVDYLRKNKLDFNRSNLELGIEVLTADALSRGMLILQKQTVTSDAELKSAIKEGLKDRERIKKEVDEFFSSHKETIFMGGDFLGPYALPRELLEKTRIGKNSFYLKENISAWESLAYRFKFRQKVLPEIAKSVLNTLPKDQFSEVTINNFPDPLDQAKIVRNGLVSTILNGRPIPLLSIDDLRKLASDALDVNLEIFKIELPLSLAYLDETDRYLRDILAQARRSLDKISPGKSPNIIALRDSFFQALNSTFLLQHPALEEEQIITDPKDLKSGVKSLWSPEFSVEMEGFRVPDPEALRRAQRLFNARGIDSRRIHNAINAWKSYEVELVSRKNRIATLNEEIKSVGQELEVTKDINFELPNAAFEDAKLVGKTYKDLVDNQKKLRIQSELIGSTSSLAKESKSYYEKILAIGKGRIPKRVDKPASSVERSIIGATAQNGRQITLALDFLAGNIQARMRQKKLPFDSWREMSLDELSFEMELVKSSINDIKNGSLLPIDLHINAITESIRQQFQEHDFRVHKRVKTLHGDNQRLKKLRILKDLALDMEFSEGERRKSLENQLKRSYHIYELENQFDALNMIKRAQTKINSLVTNPEITQWSKKGFLRWFGIAQASNITSRTDKEKLEADKKEMDEWFTEYERLDANYKPLTFPSVVEELPEIEKYFENELKNIAKAKRKKPPKSEDRYKSFLAKMENLNQEEKVLMITRALMQNSLFPYKEGLGLSRSDFVDVLYKKHRVAFALLKVPKLREEIKFLDKRFKEEARDLRIETLSTRKRRLAKERRELKDDSPQKNLVLEMQNLDLVVPVSQPE